MRNLDAQEQARVRTVLSSTRSGYSHPAYAASLSQFGTPRHLPRSNGWILERPISDSGLRDAMGCYPLFCCEDWTQLKADLDEIGSNSDLVSLVLVAEPFGQFNPNELKACFDRVDPYKEHFVTDLQLPIAEVVKPSHRATVRRAQREVDVHVCLDAQDKLGIWMDLFGNLVKRHNIDGIRAFSEESFARQLQVPGTVIFEALAGGTTVGMDWWYVQDDVAYGHLVAFNERGYQLRASYATKWAMITYFADKVRWADLGGAPGAGKNGNSGLTQFKQGWSSGTRQAYLCCKVFQQDRYRDLCEAREIGQTDYFPAYRCLEFQ